MAQRTLLAICLLALVCGQCHGWIGSWTCIDIPTGNPIDNGYYFDANYAPTIMPAQATGSKYMPNMRCDYDLTVTTGMWTLIMFAQIDIADNTCGADYMKVPLGPFEIEIVCGSETSWYTIIETHAASYQFFSDAVNEGVGVIGFMAQVPVGTAKRSPVAQDLIKQHMARRRREILSQQLDANKFHSWVEHLNQITGEINSRAAKLEALGDQSKRESNNAHDANQARQVKITRSTDMQVRSPDLSNYMSDTKLRAMKGFSCISNFHRYCGADSDRLVQAIVGSCMAKLH